MIMGGAVRKDCFWVCYSCRELNSAPFIFLSTCLNSGSQKVPSVLLMEEVNTWAGSLLSPNSQN